MSNVSDLTVIETTRRYNNDESMSVINFSASQMDVLLDWHGKLVAVGFPDKNMTSVVERRDDFQDCVTMVPQSIRSEGMRNLLRIVIPMNMQRGWNGNDLSLSSLLMQMHEFDLRMASS